MISFILIPLLSAHLMSGFLYSKSADSFVSKNGDRLSREDSIPLKFTIRLENVGKKTSEFRVIKIDGVSGNEHIISINSKGEAKLFKGEMCEAAHRTFLVSQKCSKDQREIFMWIPEDSFERFVRHIDRRRHGKNRRPGKKDACSDYFNMDGYYDDKKGKYPSNKKERHPGNISDKMRDRYSDETDDCSNLDGYKYFNRKRPRNNKKDDFPERPSYPSTTKDGSKDPTAESIYSNIFKTYMEIFCQNNSKFEQCSSFRKPTKSSTEIKDSLIPENITNFLISIFRKYGISQYSPLYRKDRGVYGQGEDPLNSSPCNCKMECVKNTKNGMCFYRYKDGKLEPIMRNPDCCRNEKVLMCDLKGKIEKLICELTMRNDYEFFSQYIDDNYKRTKAL